MENYEELKLDAIQTSNLFKCINLYKKCFSYAYLGITEQICNESIQTFDETIIFDENNTYHINLINNYLIQCGNTCLYLYTSVEKINNIDIIDPLNRTIYGSKNIEPNFIINIFKNNNLYNLILSPFYSPDYRSDKSQINKHIQLYSDERIAYISCNIEQKIKLNIMRKKFQLSIKSLGKNLHDNDIIEAYMDKKSDANINLINKMYFTKLNLAVIRNDGNIEGLINACMFISIRDYLRYILNYENITVNNLMTDRYEGKNQLFDTDNANHMSILNEIIVKYNLKIRYYINTNLNNLDIIPQEGVTYGNGNNFINIINYNNVHFELIISGLPNMTNIISLVNTRLLTNDMRNIEKKQIFYVINKPTNDVEETKTTTSFIDNLQQQDELLSNAITSRVTNITDVEDTINYLHIFLSNKLITDVELKTINENIAIYRFNSNIILNNYILHQEELKYIIKNNKK